MARKFDHAQPQVYFTSKFIKDHVYLASVGQKKKAENVFLRRSVAISTVLSLTRSELVRLAGEVHRRQSEYGRNPTQCFSSQSAYNVWSRGGEKAKDKQHATPCHARFEYKVRLVADGIYAINHFHRVLKR